MKPLRSHVLSRPIARFLLGAGLLLLAFVLLFDWNWIRPAVTSYLTHTSQRKVEIDDLHISFSAALAPTVRLRGVRIQNAPWAAPQPMATIGEISFVFTSLATLFEDQSLVANLQLSDAQVDMERLADGSRNWRLRNPEYRGPGRYRVLRLEARRSTVRFVNRGLDLEFTATETPAELVPAGTAGAAPDVPLSSRIRFAGAYMGSKFAGDVLTSAVITLQDTGTLFPLRGRAAAGATRLEVDGRVADIFRFGRIDARAHLTGPTLAQLYPYMRAHWPDSRPYDIEGRLNVDHATLALENFRGKLGDTDVAGSASVTRNTERRFWRATMRSELASIKDLASLANVGNTPGANPGKAPGKPAAQTPAERVFPQTPLRVETLRVNDAQLILEVRKFRASDIPGLDSLRMHAALQGSVLKIETLDIGLAGGHALGQLTLDARQSAPAASTTLDLRGVRLEKLLAQVPAAAGSSGAVTAQLRLEGRGESLAAMLGSASGTLTGSLADGRISNLLDAKLGLNGGKVLWLKLAGDREIALNCAALAFDFRNGVGTSRRLLIDTEQTQVNGTATVNLRDEQFDVLLTPQPKQTRLIALGSAIRAYGSFKHAQYALQKGTPPAAASAACPSGGVPGADASRAGP